MTGVTGSVVIILVAGVTIGWEFFKRSAGVALLAVDSVPAGQWKERVVNVAAPGEAVHIVTFGTIMRITGCLMRWSGCGGIISLMTIITFHPQRIKPQQ